MYKNACRSQHKLSVRSTKASQKAAQKNRWRKSKYPVFDAILRRIQKEEEAKAGAAVPSNSDNAQP